MAEEERQPIVEVISEAEAVRRVSSLRALDAQLLPAVTRGLAALQQGQRLHVHPRSEAEAKTLKGALRQLARQDNLQVRFDRARGGGFLVRLATAQDLERMQRLQQARQARRGLQTTAPGGAAGEGVEPVPPTEAQPPLRAPGEADVGSPPPPPDEARRQQQTLSPGGEEGEEGTPAAPETNGGEQTRSRPRRRSRRGI
jgi:hypothetical protein